MTFLVVNVSVLDSPTSFSTDWDSLAASGFTLRQEHGSCASHAAYLAFRTSRALPRSSPPKLRSCFPWLLSLTD